MMDDDDLPTRLESYVRGTPKMDGSEEVWWPKYRDKPGKVPATVPYPVRDDVNAAATRIRKLETAIAMWKQEEERWNEQDARTTAIGNELAAAARYCRPMPVVKDRLDAAIDAWENQ